MSTYAYGWHPSKPDFRDLVVDTRDAAAPQAEVDLRTTGLLPAVWDQLQLGACTAHGVGAAYEYDAAKQGQALGTPARLFLYYNSRSIEGTISSDSGASVKDAIKSLASYGAPDEADWAYDISKFADKPPTVAYANGVLHEAVKYASVPQDATSIQTVLSGGSPVVIGFTVYSSFESDAVAANGVMPMPQSSEAVLGGHCVLVVGYLKGSTIIAALEAKGLPTSGLDPNAMYWICRNSWNTTWGDAGYFYMPEGYLTNTNLSDDFWVVQSVSSPDPTPAPPQPIPTPSPSPSPAPSDDPDSTFILAADPWAASPHWWSKATIAAKAYKTWKATK